MPTPCSGRAALVVALVVAAPYAFAQTTSLTPRDVPARSLPVPTTVSPEIQQLIAAPLRQNWNTPPTTPEGWKALAAVGLAAAQPSVAAMRERLRVKVEPGTIDGVKVFTVTPEVIASDFDKFSQLIHASLPATRIVVIGLKPSLLRWKIRDGMHQTNKLISTRCAADRKCTYVDPWPSMIGADGTPKPSFFVEDGLHMTPEGYKAWTKMLQPHLH